MNAKGSKAKIIATISGLPVARESSEHGQPDSQQTRSAQTARSTSLLTKHKASVLQIRANMYMSWCNCGWETAQLPTRDSAETAARKHVREPY